MSRILYLVCSSLERGVKDAEARGCVRIAARRFATPEPAKDDLRIVSRFAEMHPMAGKTLLVRGSDFDDMPNPSEQVADLLDRWMENHDAFERFVAEGHAEWID
jgi:hypothetical protein